MSVAAALVFMEEYRLFRAELPFRGLPRCWIASYVSKIY